MKRLSSLLKMGKKGVEVARAQAKRATLRASFTRSLSSLRRTEEQDESEADGEGEGEGEGEDEAEGKEKGEREGAGPTESPEPGAGRAAAEGGAGSPVPTKKTATTLERLRQEQQSPGPSKPDETREDTVHHVHSPNALHSSKVAPFPSAFAAAPSSASDASHGTRSGGTTSLHSPMPRFLGEGQSSDAAAEAALRQIDEQRGEPNSAPTEYVVPYSRHELELLSKTIHTIDHSTHSTALRHMSPAAGGMSHPTGSAPRDDHTMAGTPPISPRIAAKPAIVNLAGVAEIDSIDPAESVLLSRHRPPRRGSVAHSVLAGPSALDPSFATRLERLEKQQELVLGTVLRIKSMLEALPAFAGTASQDGLSLKNQGLNDHMVGQMAAAFGAAERPK
jgi:hypothetical protein